MRLTRRGVLAGLALLPWVGRVWPARGAGAGPGPAGRGIPRFAWRVDPYAPRDTLFFINPDQWRFVESHGYEGATIRPAPGAVVATITVEPE